MRGNPNRRCRMCEDNRARLGLTPQSEPLPRIGVFDPEAERLEVFFVCPTHDLAGPVAAYPVNVVAVEA